MTLGTFLLAAGIFLTLLALFAARAARVSIGRTAPELSEARGEEIARYRSDLKRYSPFVLRVGIVMTVAGFVIVLVVASTGQ